MREVYPLTVCCCFSSKFSIYLTTQFVTLTYASPILIITSISICRWLRAKARDTKSDDLIVYRSKKTFFSWLLFRRSECAHLKPRHSCQMPSIFTHLDAKVAYSFNICVFFFATFMQRIMIFRACFSLSNEYDAN